MAIVLSQYSKYHYIIFRHLNTKCTRRYLVFRWLTYYWYLKMFRILMGCVLLILWIPSILMVRVFLILWYTTYLGSLRTACTTHTRSLRVSIPLSALNFEILTSWNPALVVQRNSISALDTFATMNTISTSTGNTEYTGDFGDLPVICPHHSNMSKVKIKLETMACPPRRVWRNHYPGGESAC